MKKIPKKEEPVIIKRDNPIYLKFRYDESIKSKRDLLISESSLLSILKIMYRYNLLRTEELTIKSGMYKAIRELDASIKKTKSIFPFLEIPERIKRKEVKEIIKMEPVKEIKPTREDLEEDLESQLQNIQARLKSLGG